VNNNEAVMQWFKDGANNTHLVNYPLNESSKVYDVGGFEGLWSSQIVALYNPYIFIFEPVKAFYEVCKERFKENPKICVRNHALSNFTGISTIDVKGDCSTVSSVGSESIVIRDADTVIAEDGDIDLISLNIEGEEYKVLPRMMDTGSINKCAFIQMQFHNVPECEEKRDEIRKKLKETHTEVYCYPFVWEGWKRR
jgi:FkbM family methyltransferase